MWDWTRGFKRVYECKGPKHLMHCTVCGDFQYFAEDDNSVKPYNWLDLGNGEWICEDCLHGYIPKKLAEEQDKHIEEIGWTTYDELKCEPTRGHATWDETQRENENYLNQLKVFLHDNDTELYEKLLKYESDFIHRFDSHLEESLKIHASMIYDVIDEGEE